MFSLLLPLLLPFSTHLSLSLSLSLTILIDNSYHSDFCSLTISTSVTAPSFYLVLSEQSLIAKKKKKGNYCDA